MKAKKSTLIIYIILFAVFNLIAFIVPSDFTIVFWISYAFTVAAFGISMFTWASFFKDDRKLSSKFLKIPTIYVSTGYFSIQFVIFLIFKFANMVPTWVAVLINAIILAAALILLISVDSASEYVQSVDDKVKVKVQSLKLLQADVEMIEEKVQDPAVKKQVAALAEKIRFSDPMSNAALADLEANISGKVETLKNTPEEEMEPLIQTISSLIDERNKKCKILK